MNQQPEPIIGGMSINVSVVQRPEGRFVALTIAHGHGVDLHHFSPEAWASLMETGDKALVAARSGLQIVEGNGASP